MPREITLDALDFTEFVRPGDLVAWGQAAAEPLPLTAALMTQRHRIGGFRAFLGITLTGTADPAHADAVTFSSYCGTGENRRLAAAGLLDPLPCHYSDMAARLPGAVDVLLVQVAEGPHGFSLSLAHEYLVPLVAAARLVIAEVNGRAPWTGGDGVLPADAIDVMVRTARPVVELPAADAGPVDRAIARRVAALIEDGSTLQMGLGGVPKAILGDLADRRDLGIHSGVIGDEVVDLIERGVVTNARKTVDRGVSVAGMLMGSRRLYQFADRNPAVSLRATAYTHDTGVLESIDRFVAINSAIEVDLTGQINAETVRGVHVGAVGGAVDFLRGAHRSRGGLPIIALPATAGGGDRTVSRIVGHLSGPVSTARSDAGIIVTEHGLADLRGLTLSQRVKRMIDVAAPPFREGLEREARQLGLAR
ncbi:acetyl-CoA hydrolase/transferase C-terminal domain-containing protein [Azospirillum sp. TSH64]|uniref:acetyl-CoA hydrolase/transferase family protein n=1 Tax=Azospirillum sp. TSH64 TaxID=652740 RepID=UPI000D621786|nr:acetyl-CoA hydrolase/transferase C-terminal domain-containing protein [Azospirillum sp. TSH64]PWC74388.1 acetyl-CoA hydrolase [Azospirillum sp. TSH64]